MSKAADVPIHDHFDGSAHCVECGGPCTLTGDALWLTEMVRWALETEIVNRGRAGLSYSERKTIERAGGDAARLIARAEASLPEWVRRG